MYTVRFVWFKVVWTFSIFFIESFNNKVYKIITKNKDKYYYKTKIIVGGLDFVKSLIIILIEYYEEYYECVKLKHRKYYKCFYSMIFEGTVNVPLYKSVVYVIFV